MQLACQTLICLRQHGTFSSFVGSFSPAKRERTYKREEFHSLGMSYLSLKVLFFFARRAKKNNKKSGSTTAHSQLLKAH